MGFPAALGAGFSAEEILHFLMRKSPEMKNKIQKTLSAGFGAERVIKFLSKDRNFQKLRITSKQEN